MPRRRLLYLQQPPDTDTRPWSLLRKLTLLRLDLSRMLGEVQAPLHADLLDGTATSPRDTQ